MLPYLTRGFVASPFLGIFFFLIGSFRCWYFCYHCKKKIFSPLPWTLSDTFVRSLNKVPNPDSLVMSMFTKYFLAGQWINKINVVYAKDLLWLLYILIVIHSLLWVISSSTSLIVMSKLFYWTLCYDWWFASLIMYHIFDVRNNVQGVI
jgi:hypothetical protein